VWAYPVTAARTPHRFTANTGEALYAAWAIDAIATPFVQGLLRPEFISISLTTECAHCGRPLRMEIDRELFAFPR
jgi:hypothetical protein